MVARYQLLSTDPVNNEAFIQLFLSGTDFNVDVMSIRASHVQLFWIFMLFQAVNTIKLNFKAGLFSSTFQFEHSFLAKSQC